MSRNDIRLRRQRMTDSARRFRNYGSVLQRHERDVRIRKIVRVFTYFAIILIIVMLIIIITRTGERLERQSQPKASLLQKESPVFT
jgi:hypothetical protein